MTFGPLSPNGDLNKDLAEERQRDLLEEAQEDAIAEGDVAALENGSYAPVTDGDGDLIDSREANEDIGMSPNELRGRPQPRERQD